MAKRRMPQAVEWLLREGGDEQPVPASSRMTFEDEHWSASIERLDIGEGLRVFLTKAEIRRGLSLEPLQSVPASGCLARSPSGVLRFRSPTARMSNLPPTARCCAAP